MERFTLRGESCILLWSSATAQHTGDSMREKASKKLWNGKLWNKERWDQADARGRIQGLTGEGAGPTKIGFTKTGPQWQSHTDSAYIDEGLTAEGGGPRISAG
jgi:hypothetical protein